MQLGLTGKVALVAASSKGLGRATALTLAQEGADVVISARGQEALERSRDEISAATGRRILAVQADVSKREDIDRLVSQALDALGRIDILVNNAGGPRPGVFTDMTDADWLAAVDLNLMSAIRLIERTLPGMRQRGWGRIVNITSISVKQPLPNIILSNTVRSGVVAMAKTLAGQVASEGVTINNVCPGYMLTDRVRNLSKTRAEAEGLSVEKVMAQSAASVPVGRLGNPMELAALIAFLASEQAAYLTGATIQMDGGMFQGLL